MLNFICPVLNSILQLPLSSCIVLCFNFNPPGRFPLYYKFSWLVLYNYRSFKVSYFILQIVVLWCNDPQCPTVQISLWRQLWVQVHWVAEKKRTGFLSTLVLIFMYKTLNDLAPDCFDSRFKLTLWTLHNLGNGYWILPRYILKKFRKSVLGCNIWNSLPLSIRYSKSLTQFKHWQNFLRNNILPSIWDSEDRAVIFVFVVFCFWLHFRLGLLHSIALLVTAVLTFTHAPLSASWRISLHIVPNELLNSESYYYYYCCYCYYYAASGIIYLWQEYHSIPRLPRGKVFTLGGHNYVTSLALGPAARLRSSTLTRECTTQVARVAR